MFARRPSASTIREGRTGPLIKSFKAKGHATETILRKSAFLPCLGICFVPVPSQPANSAHFFLLAQEMLLSREVVPCGVRSKVGAEQKIT